MLAMNNTSMRSISSSISSIFSIITENQQQHDASISSSLRRKLFGRHDCGKAWSNYLIACVTVFTHKTNCILSQTSTSLYSCPWYWSCMDLREMRTHFISSLSLTPTIASPQWHHTHVENDVMLIKSDAQVMSHTCTTSTTLCDTNYDISFHPSSFSIKS